MKKAIKNSLKSIKDSGIHNDDLSSQQIIQKPIEGNLISSFRNTRIMSQNESIAFEKRYVETVFIESLKQVRKQQYQR